MVNAGINHFYVYIYYDEGIPFYVGKGHGKRAYAHLHPSCLNINLPIYRKLKSMFENGRVADIQVIQNDLSEKEAFELEKELILAYGRRCDKTGILLNLTMGGEGESGRIVSLETRIKMSKSGLGRAKTEEHKRKIGESNFKNKMPEERRIAQIGNQFGKGCKVKSRKVIQIYKGKIFKIFDCLTDAALAVNGSVSGICNAISGRSLTHKGYQWSFKLGE